MEPHDCRKTTHNCRVHLTFVMKRDILRVNRKSVNLITPYAYNDNEFLFMKNHITTRI